MAETPSSEEVSTKLQQVAELAKKAPEMVFTTLGGWGTMVRKVRFAPGLRDLCPAYHRPPGDGQDNAARHL